MCEQHAQRHFVESQLLVHAQEGVHDLGVVHLAAPLDDDLHRLRVALDFCVGSVEMLTGFLSLTHPEEIRSYVTAWEQLMSIAVRGKTARALIRDVIAALDDPA